MRTGLIGLMGAALLPAAAAAAADQPVILATPDWAKEPTGKEWTDAWPKAAMSSGVQGLAILQCQVEADGKLSGCAAVEEAPSGLGFAQAALTLSQSYQLRSRPASGSIAFPVRFIVVRRDFVLNSSTDRLRKAPVVVPITPVWTATPSLTEVRATYGAAAGAAYVALQCGLDATGELRRCGPATGTPKTDALQPAIDRLVPMFRANVAGIPPSDLRNSTVRLDILVPKATADWRWVFTKPTWAGTFSADQSTEVFPPQAADKGVRTGRAVLSCSADAKGHMSNCRILREEPADLAFGAAAIRLASLMSINAWTEYGLPAEGTEVRFALRLNQAEPAPAAPAGQ